jgi:hypothetical protein
MMALAVLVTVSVAVPLAGLVVRVRQRPTAIDVRVFATVTFTSEFQNFVVSVDHPSAPLCRCVSPRRSRLRGVRLDGLE